MPRIRATAFILLSLLAGCVTPLPQDAPLQVMVPVLYATNRSVGDDTATGPTYSSSRGPISYGSASVALSTRKQGQSPFADWSRWQARREGTQNRNELVQLEAMDSHSFASLLDNEAARYGARDVLLYVHGFRRDFEIVAVETAAIAYETNVDAIPMFFSWPSSNSVFGYVSDTTNMRWAAADLRDMLHYLLAQNGIGKVHVIAHSLGGNGLLEALDGLSRDKTAKTSKLGEIILASPDVDTDLFRREFLPALRKLGVRTTLYATDSDFPLQTSQRVNRVRRLGDAKSEIFIADGVETVVYSDVVTLFNSHDAHVEIGDVQADLHYLIADGRGAAERPTLEPVDTDQGRYWRAQPYANRY